jgi:long-subunit fatty acid transport protein
MAVGLGAAHPALANTEPVALYDSRSVGMGGAGASFISNGSSPFLNPATLAGIKHLSVTFALSPAFPVLGSPLGPGGSAVATDFTLSPLFIFGAGYRLMDRLVIGYAMYPTAGFGAQYRLGTTHLKTSAYSMESTPSVSYELTDKLSLGLSYRITYAKQTQEVPPLILKSDLSGLNFLGFQVGVLYRPSDDLSLAFTYNSKVTTKLSGKTTLDTEYDTQTYFSTPHRIKAEVSFTTLNKRLLVALYGKYQFFADANSAVSSTYTAANGTVLRNTIHLDWKNTGALGLGAEYWVDPVFALRTGYVLAGSATPHDVPNFFAVPAGVGHSIHLGAGLALQKWDLALGSYYVFSSSDVQTPSPDAVAGPPGHYSFHELVASFSVTYHR